MKISARLSFQMQWIHLKQEKNANYVNIYFILDTYIPRATSAFFAFKIISQCLS